MIGIPSTALLGFYSDWPVFVCIAFLMLLAATPLFAAADTPPSPQPHRLYSVDGLRGYLALGVFFQHAAVYHEYLIDRRWQVPPGRFYTLLGPIAVSLFFMITGYLFWSQLIRTRGRPPWVALYIGRVYRLMPLYLAAVAVIFVVVAIAMGPHLYESPGELLQQIGRQLTAGIVQAPALNSYPDPEALLARVMWTLHYEWKFYFSLPLLAVFARSRRVHLPFVCLFLLPYPVLALIHRGQVPELTVLPLFLLGMLCASLKEHDLVRQPPYHIASPLIVALIVVTFFAGDPVKQILPQLLLGAVFYLIVAGCPLFGLLTMRPALRLGDVSYGIYLLQGLLLAAVFRLPWSRAHDAVSVIDHWLLSLAAAMLLIAVATATHVWIERTRIQRGKRLIAKLRARWPQFV